MCCAHVHSNFAYSITNCSDDISFSPYFNATREKTMVHDQDLCTSSTLYMYMYAKPVIHLLAFLVWVKDILNLLVDGVICSIQIGPVVYLH